MDKKCVIIEEKETTMTMASKIDTAKEAEKSTVRSLTLKGVPSDSIPSFQEISRPIYTDPSKNFEKLSEYLIERITKLTMKNMKRLCKKRSVSLDLDYWRHYTVKLLSSSSTEVTIIVPSPAGSGKSTWIEAFTSAISELFLSELKMSYAIVGVVVVLQKVEDLNRLAATLNSDFSSNNPMMVSLQGWTLSGQQEGFCRNTGVKCFEDCLPVSCPFATSCELRTFQSKALVAPILGLTQERFCMLRSSNNLDSVFYRTMENGQFLPRRFLIFDEKYEMAEINTLDKNILDEASIEITKLIPKLSVTDRFVMGLQKEMSYFIEWPYQKIRGKLHISTQDGVQDLQAGFCSLDDLEICQDIQYAKFRSFVLEHKRKYSSKQLQEAFSVMDGLYAGEKCLFSNYK